MREEGTRVRAKVEGIGIDVLEAGGVENYTIIG